ncbi:MAG: hypothetical protein J6386_01960 [Candidatus Synoicihabitans palmerolidicus]|nr:hypothetical protein [Candidatus Synoicihabitans palmerolidicus]
MILLVFTAWALRQSFTERIFWNIDESVTFTIAHQILDGDVLYRDAVDHRGPLVPYLKAALLALVGDWNLAIFALDLGLFAVDLQRLAARFGDERTGWFAAAVFTVLSFVILGPVETMALHTEWFMEAFSRIGFLLFARAYHRLGIANGIAVGACFGLSALNKQPGLFDFGVVLVVGVGGVAWFHYRKLRAQFIRFLMGTVIGVAIPFVAA